MSALLYIICRIPVFTFFIISYSDEVKKLRRLPGE